MGEMTPDETRAAVEAFMAQPQWEWDYPEYTCSYCREKKPVDSDGNISCHQGCPEYCPPLEQDFDIEVEWERIRKGPAVTWAGEPFEETS